jgi:hypothetical protein
VPTTRELPRRIRPSFSRALRVVIYGLPVLATIGVAEAVGRVWSIADGALAARWLFILGCSAVVFITTESVAHRVLLFAQRGRPGVQGATGLGSTGSSGAVAALCVVLFLVTQGTGRPGSPIHHLVAQGHAHKGSASFDRGSPSTTQGTLPSVVPATVPSLFAPGRLTPGSGSTATADEQKNTRDATLADQPDNGSSGVASVQGATTAIPPASPSTTAPGATPTIVDTTPPTPVPIAGVSPSIPVISVTSPSNTVTPPSITITASATPAPVVATTGGAPAPRIATQPIGLNAFGIEPGPPVPAALGPNATVTTSLPAVDVPPAVDSAISIGSVSVTAGSDSTNGGKADVVATEIAPAAEVTDPSVSSVVTDIMTTNDTPSVAIPSMVITVES